MNSDAFFVRCADYKYAGYGWRYSTCAVQQMIRCHTSKCRRFRLSAGRDLVAALCGRSHCLSSPSVNVALLEPRARGLRVEGSLLNWQN